MHKLKKISVKKIAQFFFFFSWQCSGLHPHLAASERSTFKAKGKSRLTEWQGSQVLSAYHKLI